MAGKLELHYFACRSRGEPIRLALAASGAEWEEFSVPEVQSGFPKEEARRQIPPPEPERSRCRYLSGAAGDLKNVKEWPYATCPKLVDGDFCLVQSNAILRYLGRRFGLYGEQLTDYARVDSILDALEDVRTAYNELIYGLDAPPFRDELTNDDPTVAAAFKSAGVGTADRFRPFERFLAESGEPGYFVANKLTIADLAVYDLFDLHLRIWGSSTLAPGNSFERLHVHRTLVEKVPAVASYLSSNRRWSRINGNMLG
mmetsp:Transcript_79478/g.233611  ORF Transcript_79478/g.233611 Transcript_79478/m.233611 type:complete len:257 (-) Transcript_79478:20-790(-)